VVCLLYRRNKQKSNEDVKKIAKDVELEEHHQKLSPKQKSATATHSMQPSQELQQVLMMMPNPNFSASTQPQVPTMLMPSSGQQQMFVVQPMQMQMQMQPVNGQNVMFQMPMIQQQQMPMIQQQMPMVQQQQQQPNV